jgi:hypothetical protein
VLAQLRSNLTYSNVMATVAVFVALGGTSYAVATGSIDGREIKNNTVRSKDIRNNAVTARDIRNGSAGGGDVRNDSLTGDDVLESSLGTVPSANSAGTADDASTASNASALGGLGPEEFLRSNVATIRNPVSVDDPAGDPSTRTPLMTAGNVTIEGECFDNGTHRTGKILATASSQGTFFARILLDLNGQPAGSNVEFVAGADEEILRTPEDTGEEQRMAAFSLHHPASNTYRSGTMFVSVNSGSDCAFAITAFG